jgi:hypothetical protein
VITEDDYVRYLTRSDVTNQLPSVLLQRIRERHLLFLGYSMRDWNLRVVLERLGGSEVMQKQAWCVQLEPETEDARDIELALWGDRDVDLVFDPLDVYVKRIEEQLDRIAEDEA